MAILQTIGLVLGGVIALALLVAALLPKKYRVARTQTINASPEKVYNFVVDFNNYLQWNPWSEQEPTAQNAITGTPGTVGCVWSWEGKKVGVGRQIITSVDAGKTIEMKLEFDKPMKSVAVNGWIFTPAANGTTVDWWITGDNPYPIGRFFGLMMDKMLGKDFEKGLANLKKAVESAKS